MLAAVLHAPGDLKIEETTDPIPGPGEAIIQVITVGVCGSDLGRVMHTGTYSMPLIPGHEFSGRIQKLFTEYKGPLREGDPVAAAPIIPCRVCPACQNGHFGLCSHYDYIGSRRNGAMAQQVSVPVQNLLKLPDGFSPKWGAMIEPAAVTLHGMKYAGVEAGDTVCVLGCGTIGLLAVQLARIMGACKVIASDIDPEKRRLAEKLGAYRTVNPLEETVEQVISSEKDGQGCDLVVETAGVPQTQQSCVLLARFRGRILLLGTAHKPVSFDPACYEQILRKELTLYGSWNSYSAPFPGTEWLTCIKYAADGQLHLDEMISHTISLSELPAMIAAMHSRSIPFTKVVALI